MTTSNIVAKLRCEDIYLRHEDKDWLIARAKLVHADFVQPIGAHWCSRSRRWKVLDPGRIGTS